MRRTKPVYLILCEGETEEAYFSQLNSIKELKSLTLKVKKVKSNVSQKEIDQLIKQLSAPEELVQVYLVFDGDVPEVVTHLKSLKKVHLAISYPCFELWLLLHIDNQTSAISSNECFKALQKSLPNYQKGQVLKQIIKIAHIKEAIKKAQALSFPNNPSSSVSVLMNLITTSPSA